MPSFVRPFVGRTLHNSGGVLGAQVKTIPETVDFDFSKLSFVRPSGVVFLSNLVLFLHRNDCLVTFSGMDVAKVAIKFLDDSLFFEQHIGNKLDGGSCPRITTLPLLEIRHSESHGWIRSEFVPWLSNCAEIHIDNLSELATCLSELFNNIDDHTELDVGSVFAQWYPQEARVIVAVANFGQGIPGSVGRVCDGMSDNEAIIQAFKSNFTSQSTPRNRGIGLHFLLQNVVETLNGKVEVHSGNGAVIFKNVGNLLTPVPYMQKGYCPDTLIVLEFDTSLIERTVILAEEFEW